MFFVKLFLYICRILICLFMKNKENVEKEYTEFGKCMEQAIMDYPKHNLRDICNKCGKTYNAVYEYVRRDDFFSKRWDELKKLYDSIKNDELAFRTHNTAIKLLEGHMIRLTKRIYKRRRDANNNPLSDAQGNPIMELEDMITEEQEISPSEKLTIDLLKSLQYRDGEIVREKENGVTTHIQVNVVDKRNKEKTETRA